MTVIINPVYILQRKTKIFVGRLPENCRNDELRQLFLRFGEVTECDVMNRYGFVHMAREEDAAAAIKALHNSNFKGATINVEQSTGKSRGGGGGRRDGDRRGGPMRGGRGGRDGGRDARPGPYNDRRGTCHILCIIYIVYSDKTIFSFVFSQVLHPVYLSFDEVHVACFTISFLSIRSCCCIFRYRFPLP